jgi:hypothetical protein
MSEMQPLNPIPEDDTPEVTETPKEPLVSKSDTIVVLVLLALGLGGWFWYSSAGKTSHAHFAHADSLYQQGQWKAALLEYQKLRETEGFISKSDDSLLYRRMDSLETIQETSDRWAQAARLALQSGDTALIRKAALVLESAKGDFIPSSLLDSVKSNP